MNFFLFSFFVSSSLIKFKFQELGTVFRFASICVCSIDCTVGKLGAQSLDCTELWLWKGPTLCPFHFGGGNFLKVSEGVPPHPLPPPLPPFPHFPPPPFPPPTPIPQQVWRLRAFPHICRAFNGLLLQWSISLHLALCSGKVALCKLSV